MGCAGVGGVGGVMGELSESERRLREYRGRRAFERLAYVVRKANPKMREVSE